MVEIRNNVSLKANPTEPEHITNVEYVNGRSVEISWIEYQALSEEEKNNGVMYLIPDMPVGINTEAVGEIERFNGYLDGNSTLAVDSPILFIPDSNSNMTIENGYFTLKKGKSYLITASLECIYSDQGSTHYVVCDEDGKYLSRYGFDISTTYATHRGGNVPLHCVANFDKDTKVCIKVAVLGNFVRIAPGYCNITITEIPSYKGLLDVTDQRIKEIAQEDRNIKTYNSLESLGLSAPITVGEIYTALPENSIARLSCSSLNITDCPERYGILMIDKQSTWRFDITFKATSGGVYDVNRKYLGILKADDGTGLTWDRICTTNVSDISPTEIVLDNEKFVKEDDSSKISYCVVNGLCTINVEGVGVINTGYNVVCSGLPVPVLGKARGNLQVEAYSSNPTKPVYIQVVGDTLSIFSSSSTGPFYGGLSYPVAES